MADLQMKTFNYKTNNLIKNLPPRSEDPTTCLQEALENWGPNKLLRDTFEFKQVTQAETFKVINSLSNNTSTAHDRICATAVKTGAAVLAGPIAYIVNLSISNSEFPAKWKIGCLLPLHKGKGVR